MAEQARSEKSEKSHGADVLVVVKYRSQQIREQGRN
jgi:hypothetical protein